MSERFSLSVSGGPYASIMISCDKANVRSYGRIPIYQPTLGSYSIKEQYTKGFIASKDKPRQTSVF